jgi:hypothetical protein
MQGCEQATVTSVADSGMLNAADACVATQMAPQSRISAAPVIIRSD